MGVTVVVGAQWGEEGKGHIVDCLRRFYSAPATAWMAEFWTTYPTPPPRPGSNRSTRLGQAGKQIRATAQISDSLPPAACAYPRRIEELARAPIRYVSVGPERSQIVVL